jgi:hypothetical protein
MITAGPVVDLLWDIANTMNSKNGGLNLDSYMVKMLDGLIRTCDKIGRIMEPAPSRLVRKARFGKFQI